MSTFLNESKLDKTNIYIETSLPVYITMSTIPSRLSNTYKIIKNFLEHVQGFEKLILNIPWSYRRWPNLKLNNLKEFDNIKDSRFILNRTDDFGPLTKFLPSLTLIPNNSITIICDDMCYNLTAFKDIAEKQDNNRGSSFSFYVYDYNGVKVPQGADLISLYTRNADNFISWYNELVKKLGIKNYYDSPCFFVDDQVIGWYLQHQRIPMEQVDRHHRNIYISNCDISNKNDNLNRQTGRKSRDYTMKKCNQELQKTFPL